MTNDDEKEFEASKKAREYASQQNYTDPKYEAAAMFGYADGWSAARKGMIPRASVEKAIDDEINVLKKIQNDTTDKHEKTSIEFEIAVFKKLKRKLGLDVEGRR
jgi:hypothetical protein